MPVSEYNLYAKQKGTQTVENFAFSKKDVLDALYTINMSTSDHVLSRYYL